MGRLIFPYRTVFLKVGQHAVPIMSDDDSSFEDLYREDADLNFEGILYRESSEGWTPSTDIDWDIEIDLPEEKREALADGATQFHYSNTSHLMLCGRLLEQAPDMQAKKLALFLAFSKMRNIDAWGRYLGKLAVKSEIPPQTKDYFRRMTEEDDLATLLLGMGVLGGTVGYGVLEVFKEPGDPVFAQMAEKMVAQKGKNEELLAGYLGSMVDSSEEERLEQIEELAKFYRAQSEKIVYAHSDSYEKLGIEPDRVAESVLEATDEFYRKIGLNPREL